jgi:galactitol-specific phosphotransferase system IIC component
VHKSSILANWVQIEMGKTWKTINVDVFNFWNHKTLQFSYVVLKHVQNLILGFKFYITQRFNILVKSIAS